MSSIDPGELREPLTSAQVRLIRSAGIASVSVALTLVVLKVYAWIATGSVALLSSLADSLLDLLASSMTLLAVRFAFEPADREHRFGHGKLEAVAGLAQGLVITGSAAWVAIEAIGRLLAPEPVVAPAVGTVVMLISLVLTLGLVLYQNFVTRRTGSIAIGADELHYRGDVLTSLAVLLAIGASSAFGWHRADPLLGLVVVVVILSSVRAIVLRSLDILLDRELPGSSRREILELAAAHEAVHGVHDLRTRTSGTHEFIQFHLELDPGMTLVQAHAIMEEVERAVTARFPRAEVIIHADPHGQGEPRDRF